MALPESYTESSLATFMMDALGKTGTVLGWAADSGWDETINNALILYGTDSVEDADNLPKLRACARYTAWLRVWAEVAGDFHFMTDGQSFHREQRFEHVTNMLAEAQLDLDRHGVSMGGIVDIYEIQHPDSGFLRQTTTEFS